MTDVKSVPTSLPIILAHGACPVDRVIYPFSNNDNRDDDRGEAVTGVDRETFERNIREFYVKIARGLRD